LKPREKKQGSKGANRRKLEGAAENDQAEKDAPVDRGRSSVHLSRNFKGRSGKGEKP
jgi:hypothetical protein